MSSLYRIEKLTLHNFKLFGGELTINFDENDLIVFDGPNGFGKTTVFDAIELALTGSIRRLVSLENQQNPTDVVVAHRNSSDCFVQITLKKNENTICVERRLKTELPSNATRISKFKEIWDLFLITDEGESAIQQSRFNELIGNANVERDFIKFHYVEQQDTAHFLKDKKEKERAAELAVLFGDTEEMQLKVEKIEAVEKTIADEIKAKKNSKITLEESGKVNQQVDIEVSELTYKALLQLTNQNIEWVKCQHYFVPTFSSSLAKRFKCKASTIAGAL